MSIDNLLSFVLKTSKEMAGAISFYTSTTRPFLDVRQSLLVVGKFSKPRSRLAFNFISISSMATPLQLQASASSSVGEGTTNEAVKAMASPGLVGQDDLLIVGPGVLGRLVAEQWREEHPGCQIYGQTATTDHHGELIQMGINASLNWSATAKRFPYVLFCAPPSRTSDYPGDDSPVVPIGRHPRVDVLLKAENVVLELGGCIIRLAGLYKEDRGAHTFCLKQGTVERRPDHILNLIHYELPSVAILKKKLHGGIFLGCDNHPLSRQELMELVNKSGKYDETFVAFTGTSDALGKKLDNTKTRKEIGWEPKHPSFSRFLGVAE